MDLEMFFSVGSTATVSAQNTFTNRTTELDVFARALTDQNLDQPVRIVEDLRAPRRNVLVFYGLGGVGKSRLSHELEARYLAADEPDLQQTTMRVDFDGGGVDLESLLLGLRAALGTRRAVWPAFDLAFAAYWEKAHLGVPLQTAVNDSSLVRRVTRDLNLGDQLQAAIEGLLASPGGLLGIFTAGARLAGRSVRDRLVERRLMRDCPFFEPVTSEADPARMLIYLASLLAWDLAQHQQKRNQQDKRFRLVVFFDTWERVQQGPRYRGNREDLLSRVVYQLPNVLFVITGRNQLRWADSESRACMQWAGPEHWPYLADGVPDVEPSQHLVGGLSAVDADRFLRRRLLRDAEPAIPEDVRAAIIGAADGLPLYLDLAAVRFAQLAADGARPTPTDFGEPFPEVVLRLLRDLEQEQRTLLRMASLVNRFDADLLLAGDARLTDSALDRFVRRSLVQHHPRDHLPYSIHESLREAVRTADVAEDRWSEREWAHAARRLLESIHRRVRPELGASGSVDGALLAGLFKESYCLSLELGELPEWLWLLASRLHSLGTWEALEWPATVTPDDSPLGSAGLGLEAIARRRQRGPEATAVELRRCLADARLDGTGRQYFSYWLGWQLDEIGEWDEAEQVRLSVAGGDGPFVPYVRHALARADWVCGRLTRSNSYPFDGSDPLQVFWSTGIRGRIAWILGRFDEAEPYHSRRIETAERLRSPEMLAHALRTLAEQRCFTRAGDVTAAREAADIYQRVGSPVSRAESLMCVAVSRVGSVPLAESLAAIGTIAPDLRGSPHAAVAEVFARCVDGDATGAAIARQRLRRAGGRPAAYGYWWAITGWWLDELSPTAVEAGSDGPAGGVDWVHGETDARRRWVEVLRARRATV